MALVINEPNNPRHGPAPRPPQAPRGRPGVPSQHGAPGAIKKQQTGGGSAHAQHGAPGAIKKQQTRGYGGYRKGSVRAMQAYLRDKGYYHGSIDGIKGPRTNAAAASYRNRFKKASGGGSGGSHPGRSGGGGGGSGRSGGGGGGGGGGSRQTSRRSGGGGGGGSGLINAQKYAHAETNQQYGGLIAELQRQRNEQALQGEQNLADIRSWYGHVADTAAANLTSGDAYASKVENQQQGDIHSLIASLGGAANGAAGSVGSFGALMQGALAGQASAEHGYAANQKTLAAQGMAQAETNQQNSQSTAQGDIRAKLAQALSERGAAYTKNLYDAKQIKLQQQAAQQNMQIAASEMGLKMAQFSMDAKTTRLQQQNMALTNRALGQQMADRFKKTPWKHVTAGDRAKLVSGVNRVMYNPADGNAKMHPKDAWNKASNMLRSLGYNVHTNPSARRWLSQSWANYVVDYNDSHKKPYHAAKNGTPYVNW